MFALAEREVDISRVEGGSNFSLLASPSSKIDGILRTCLFGFRIPYLPDFSLDPHFKREGREEFLNAFHERWVSLIQALSSRRNVGLSLRYIYEPSTAEIKIAFIGSILITEHQVDPRVIATEIVSVLSSVGIPLEPIEDEATLKDWIEPLIQPYVAEVRSREFLLSFESRFDGPSDAYVVLPVGGPKGDWLDVLRTMKHQKHRLIISTYLYPTCLFQEENEYLRYAAGRMEQELKFYPQTRYGVQFDATADPNCEVGREIYVAALARLQEPFICASQVMSNDPGVANTIANMLKAAVQADNINSDASLGKHPQGVDVVCSAESSLSAQITLNCGWPMAWGGTEASNKLRRWKYLLDARSAAAFFRLPIPSVSGLPGIEVRKPRVGMAMHTRNTNQAVLEIAATNSGHTISIPLQEITRHALVCGIPGSGKTNTCLRLLDQLWVDYKIPFWVIEPAKTEYRRLTTLPGFTDALVFTLGDEEVAPFRLNPFEVASHLSLERHLNDLEQVMQAGMPGLARDERLLPMLLMSAIRDAYKANGWRVSDKGSCGKSFPVWGELWEYAEAQCENYAGDVRKNAKAALDKRVRVLSQGYKGRMLNTPKGIDWKLLMSRPVVFEVQAMGESSKLIILLLLMRLRQEAAQRTSGNLAHVVLLEEAHRVIGAAPKGNEVGNEDGAIASTAENMLAELRGYGEGIIIAEQSPSKLIPGALALTSLKIVHRLASKEDVEAVGSSLGASEEQVASFQRLRVGEAAVLADRMEGITFGQVNTFKNENGFFSFLRDSEARDQMAGFYAAHKDARLPFLGCCWCKQKCAYREIISQNLNEGMVMIERSVPKRLKNSPTKWIKEIPPDDRKILIAGLQAIEQQGGSGGVAWCLVAHAIDEDQWLTHGDYEAVIDLVKKAK